MSSGLNELKDRASGSVGELQTAAASPKPRSTVRQLSFSRALGNATKGRQPLFISPNWTQTKREFIKAAVLYLLTWE